LTQAAIPQVIASLDLIVLALNRHRPASLHNPFTLTHPVLVIGVERMPEEFNHNE
jgi:hypothetical protein